MATTDQKKRPKKNLMIKALEGRLISTDFFARHWLATVAVMLMLLIYITNRYRCQTLMETIQTMEQELEVVKTERIREKSLYMSRTRESSMQEMVDSMHLNLKVQDNPPYTISRSR